MAVEEGIYLRRKMTSFEHFNETGLSHKKTGIQTRYFASIQRSI